jgi:hypothetical protein
MKIYSTARMLLLSLDIVDKNDEYGKNSFHSEVEYLINDSNINTHNIISDIFECLYTRFPSLSGMCSKNIKVLCEKFEYIIISLFSVHKLNMPTDLFKYIVNIHEQTIYENRYPLCNVINILISFGYIPSDDDLLNACKYKLPDIINIFLKYVKPTQKHYEMLFDDIQKYYMNTKSKKKFVTRFNNYCDTVETIQEIVEYFITNGYKLTISDILTANNAMCPLKQINDIGISISELLNTQYVCEYFPYIVNNNKLVPNLLYAL